MKHDRNCMDETRMDVVGKGRYQMLNKGHGAVIVAWDFSEGPGVALAGFQEKGEVIVINKFSGKEAHELIEKIINRKES